MVNLDHCGLVAKSCLTLCNPMDHSPPSSSVHGIFQARILAWLPIPSPGDLPHPGIEPGSPALHVDSLQLSHQGSCIPYDMTILINRISESVTTANILLLLLPPPHPSRGNCFAFHVISTILLGIIPTFSSLLMMNCVA